MQNQARLAARLSEFPDGTMRVAEFDGAKILLVRRGDEVFALEATCPHAGGPLAEGVLVGDRVVCPWHKAEFCVRTGACTQPPALDELARFPVELRDGAVWLVPDAPIRSTPVLSKEPDSRRFVLVGGGAAGAVAAQTLRTEGFSGSILMIDAEGELPYDRTVLSKYVLSGAKAGEKSPLQTADFYHRLAIERRQGRVRLLDPIAKIIMLEDGTGLTYDAALIATGGKPIRPDIPGHDLQNVFLLRSKADVAHLLAAAIPGHRAIVLGASFIGMEAAAGLRERGLDVTIVADQSAPFEQQLGAEVGAIFLKMHEAEGVAFRLGRTIVRITGEGAVAGVELDDGECLEGDFIVVGQGVRPETGFVTDVRLRDDGGITVDADLRVADGLYAAGDIAAFPLQGDGPTVRVEHWRVAEQQGALAARNMLGAGLRFEAVPYFWTIQFMKRLDYVGHGSGNDTMTMRGDPEKPEFIAYYQRDGRVLAAAGWNRDRDMAALITLMSRRHRWSVDEIHPPHSSPSAVLRSFQS